MKAYYFYERDSKRRPMKTACLLMVNNLLAVGISLCNSKLDQPVKKIGRELSYIRALEAILTKSSKKFEKSEVYRYIFNPNIDKIPVFKKLVEKRNKENENNQK